MSDTATRPAAANVVIWVERESGFTVGHCRTFEDADALARECNELVPTDPARVAWSPTLASS